MDIQPLLDELVDLDSRAAAERLGSVSDVDAAAVLTNLGTARAIEILWRLPEARRVAIAEATPFGRGQHWLRHQEWPEGTVGRLLEQPLAVFRPDDSVAHVVETLREIVRAAFVTYVFVTLDNGRLVGVVAFRELLFARREQALSEVMIEQPFCLTPTMTLVEAMRETVTRHYPSYPICDDDGRLVGMVRGHVLFQAQAYEISAQAGSMVGVEKEERLATPWPRSLRFRHPWLQLNLLTAFVAAAVVGYFQDTIDRIVVLAVFLPVLAGQSGNTGCQALAVTLRGMTLGELRPGRAGAMVAKEALLGLLNGLLVGVVAGAGMLVVAIRQGQPAALGLAAIVAVAMAASCLVSGVSGALIPLVLKRLGADPATASSIFLTTATDVASMGFFLGLATLLLR